MSGLLISPAYAETNFRLHADPKYGATGAHYSVRVLAESISMGTRDILDYGCGKCALQSALGFPINNYDPSLPEFAKKPKPARIVVCSEVLEHIEAELLENVLDDLRRVTKTILLASVSTGPAQTILPDGRNAHLIQKPVEWWLPKFERRFGSVVSGPTPRGPLGFSIEATP